MHKSREALRRHALEGRHQALEVVIPRDGAMQEVGVDVNVLGSLATAGIDGEVADVESLAGVGIDERDIVDVDMSCSVVKAVSGERRRHVEVEIVGRILS